MGITFCKLFNKEKNININENNCKISGDPNIDLDIALNSSNFTDWKKDIPKDWIVNGVHFQSYDFFGKRIGFIKWITDVTINGIKAPGIVFARGGCVSILVVISVKGDEDNCKYTVLVKQARVPISRVFTEVPAGMLDGEGDFSGVAAKELGEEADIHINKDKLIDMTQLAYNDKYKGMYTMVGASDEFIRQYVYFHEVTREELNKMEGKCTGEIQAGEVITLKICKLEEVWRETSDSKTLSSILLYEKLSEASLL